MYSMISSLRVLDKTEIKVQDRLSIDLEYVYSNFLERMKLDVRYEDCHIFKTTNFFLESLANIHICTLRTL